MSEIRRLQTFVDLVRLGTVSAVAEASSYSTSAVSQQIDRLEADLGVELVEPHGRRLRLTAAGRELAHHAPTVLDAWEATRSSVAASAADMRGAVTLAAFQTACLTIVPALVATLGERLPLLEVHCVQAEPERALPGVLSREFDVAIVERYAGRPPVQHAELTEEWLGEDAMYVAAPRGSRARSLHDLADVPWTLEARAAPAREWALDACRRAGFEPRAAHETSDVIVQCAFASSGAAAAMIPGLTPRHLFEGLSLIELPADEARTLGVIMRARSAPDPRVRAVVAAIHEAMASISSAPSHRP